MDVPQSCREPSWSLSSCGPSSQCHSWSSLGRATGFKRWVGFWEPSRGSVFLPVQAEEHRHLCVQHLGHHGMARKTVSGCSTFLLSWSYTFMFSRRGDGRDLQGAEVLTHPPVPRGSRHRKRKVLVCPSLALLGLSHCFLLNNPVPGGKEGKLRQQKSRGQQRTEIKLAMPWVGEVLDCDGALYRKTRMRPPAARETLTSLKQERCWVRCARL